MLGACNCSGCTILIFIFESELLKVLVYFLCLTNIVLWGIFRASLLYGRYFIQPTGNLFVNRTTQVLCGLVFLNDQVNKNSATVSSSLFFPQIFTVMVLNSLRNNRFFQLRSNLLSFITGKKIFCQLPS